MEIVEQEDFSKLSVEDRVQHKNWKARVSGYEELAKKFPTFEDKEFSKFAPLLKKFVIDSNAAAQEKGLSAVLAFIDYAPMAGKYVENILGGVIMKCLNSGKAKTKELALEIILKSVEIEKQDVVLEELIKGLEQKVPKNVAAVIRTIREALSLFGPKVITVKPLVPHLSKLLEDRDAGVRDETKKLAIEVYRWVKDALLPQLSSLKPILLEPLQAEFEKVKGERAFPTRLLRSQQEMEVVAGTDDQDGGNPVEAASSVDAEPEEIDPFELLDPVNILSKLPSDFYTLIESKKWQDRKDALEKLQQLCEQNPKLLTSSDYSELVKNLRRIVSKDSNVIVVTFAIKCIMFLATGLRKAGFERYANGCITVLFEKFKEKKPNVVAALRDSIDAVYLCTTLEAFHEDLVTVLDNKNPSIRSEVALFCARCFAKTNPALINKKLLKTVVTCLLKTLSDPDAVVRESSAEALGTCYKQQGERNMKPLLLELEALKMAKITEYIEKAVVTKFVAPAAAPSAAAAAKPKTAPVRRPTGAKKPVDNDYDIGSFDLGPEPASKAAPAVARPVARSATIAKGPVKRPATTRPASKTAPSKKAEESSSSLPLMNTNVKAKDVRFNEERTLKVLKWNFTTPRQEYHTILKEQLTNAEWNPSLVAAMFNADFKFHIKAIEQISKFFANPDNEMAVPANSDLILKWFALRFFDTNPAMILKGLDLVIQMFKILNDQNAQLHDYEASSFFPYLILKLGDSKAQIQSKTHTILELARGIYSSMKILSHLHSGLQSKNARQRAVCLDEIAQLISIKGVGMFQPPNNNQMLRDIAKLVSERDTSVRNSALKCIVQVYTFVGENVYKLINATALNDKDINIIEERIKRAPKPAVKEVEEQSSPRELPPPASSSRMQAPGTPSRQSSSSRLSLGMSDDAPKPKFDSPPSMNSNMGTILKSKLGGPGASKIGGTMLRRPATAAAPLPVAVYDDYVDEEPTYQQEAPLIQRFDTPRYSDSSSVVTSDSDDLISTLSKASPFSARVKQILESQPPQVLTPQRLKPLPEFASPFRTDPDFSEKLENVLQDLSSLEPETAMKGLVELKAILVDYQKYSQYLDWKTDQLIVLFNKQMRLYLTRYREQPQHDLQNQLFRSTIQRLRNVLSLPLGKKISRDSLRELLAHLMPYLIEMRQNKFIHNSITSLPNDMINGVDTTFLYCALFKKMHEYIGEICAKKNNPEEYQRIEQCLELTMKFIWRLMKQTHQKIDEMNIDLILLESHIFYRDYPKSWFKTNKIPDISLKTVKTVVYTIIQSKGEAILNHMSLIQDRDSSELYYYIQKSIRQCETSITSSNASPAPSRVQEKNGGDDKINTPKTAVIIPNGALNPLAKLPLAPRFDNSDTVPIIKTEQDLAQFCEYACKQLNVEMDTKAILESAKPVHSVAEVENLVENARVKMEELKARLNC